MADLLAALEFLVSACETTDRRGVCIHVPSALETARAAIAIEKMIRERAQRADDAAAEQDAERLADGPVTGHTTLW